MKTNRFFVILLLWSGILSAQTGTFPPVSPNIPTVGIIKYASNTPYMTYFTVETGDGLYEIMASDVHETDLSTVRYSLPFTHPLSQFWVEAQTGFLLEMKEDESVLRIYNIGANGELEFLALKRLPIAYEMKVEDHQLRFNHGEYFSFYSLENPTTPTFVESLTAAETAKKALNVANTSVYPNPSSEKWTLDLRKLPKTTYVVSVIDLNGKIVMDLEVENELVLIENPQTTHLYFYSVSQKNGTFLTKGKLMSN